MRIALDDDSASRQLVSALRKGGHEVSTPIDLGIAGAAGNPDSHSCVRGWLLEKWVSAIGSLAAG
jgi:hypothetical protein